MLSHKHTSQDRRRGSIHIVKNPLGQFQLERRIIRPPPVEHNNISNIHQGDVNIFPRCRPHYNHDRRSFNHHRRAQTPAPYHHLISVPSADIYSLKKKGGAQDTDAYEGDDELNEWGPHSTIKSKVKASRDQRKISAKTYHERKSYERGRRYSRDVDHLARQSGGSKLSFNESGSENDTDSDSEDERVRRQTLKKGELRKEKGRAIARVE